MLIRLQEKLHSYAVIKFINLCGDFVMVNKLKINGECDKYITEMSNYLRRIANKPKSYIYSIALSTMLFMNGCTNNITNNSHYPYSRMQNNFNVPKNVYSNTNNLLTATDNISAHYKYAIYDQQEVITFNKIHNKISADVVAVPQVGKKLLSYMYLINAVTDKNWWYQYGIYYSALSSNNQINITVNIYDSEGVLRDLQFIRPKIRINPNDTVHLTMKILNNNVVMDAFDKNNGSDIKYTQKLYGSKFIGGRFKCKNGSIITGLMSELYYTGYHYQIKEKPVTFTSSEINYYKISIAEDVLNSGVSKYYTNKGAVLVLGESANNVTVASYAPKPDQWLNINGKTKIQFIGSKIPIILNPLKHQIIFGGN